MWLRHRLAAAERGSDLLRQKLMMLAREQFRLHAERDRTVRDWLAADRAARGWLARASALDGDGPVSAVMADTGPLLVATQWTTVMGVRYPLPPAASLPADPRPVGGPASVRSVTAYREAALAAVQAAAATRAAATVDAEIALTRQRVRALDRHWVPRLRDALVTAQLRMSELETEDIARRGRTAARV